MRYSTIFATASLFFSAASALTIPVRYAYNDAREHREGAPAVSRRELSRRAAHLAERMLEDELDTLASRAPTSKGPPKRSPKGSPKTSPKLVPKTLPKSPKTSPKGSPKGSPRTTPNPSRPSSPSGNPGLQALSVLAPALQKLGVKYGIIGGAAAAALGSSRATTDIDLVMFPAGNLNAESLSQTLTKTPGFEKVTQFGVSIPAVRVGSTLVEVEIFDPPSWPQRPQYNDVQTQTQTVSLRDGVSVSVFNAAWQLREKIVTAHERGSAPGSPKATTDLQDIRFLASKIPPASYGKGLLVFAAGSQYKEAFNALIVRKDLTPEVAAALKQIVKVL